MSVGFVGIGITMAQFAQRTWFMPEGRPAFSFDCTIREAHRSQLTVTKNPVETGVSVSDHAYMNPLELEIEAAVGEVWLAMREPADAAAMLRGEEVSAKSDLEWLRGGQTSRPINAFSLLQGIQRDVVVFGIQTGLRFYPDMVVQDLETSQDAKTSTFLQFRATLVQIIRVGTDTVTFTPRSKPAVGRKAAKKADGGEKQGKPPATAQEIESDLFQMTTTNGQFDFAGVSNKLLNFGGRVP